MPILPTPSQRHATPSEVMTLDEAKTTAKKQNFAIPPEELIVTWAMKKKAPGCLGDLLGLYYPFIGGL